MNAPTTSPTDLWRRGKRCSEEFRRVHEKTDLALRRWVELNLPRTLRARVDPDDVLQEVWRRAWLHRDDIGHTGSLRRWLRRVASTVIIDLVRSRSRDPRSNQSVRELVGPSSASGTAHRNEMREAIRRYAEGCREIDRALILRVGLGQEPIDCVAEDLGLSLEAARRQWHRRRQQMRLSKRLRRLIELEADHVASVDPQTPTE